MKIIHALRSAIVMPFVLLALILVGIIVILDHWWHWEDTTDG